MNNKILSMLSISKRAGKIKAGDFSCEEALKKQTAKIIFIAGDASANTKKKFKNKAFFYKIPLYEYLDKETLSHAIGAEKKTVFAITDENIARKIIELMNELGEIETN